MKYQTSILTGAAVLGLLAAATNTTQAGLSFGITIGGCAPPVVMHAPPPPVIYHPPRAVIHVPAPPVVQFRYNFGGHRHHYHRGFHGHGHHLHKHHRHGHRHAHVVPGHPRVYRHGHH